jgi:hypothetical protein
MLSADHLGRFDSGIVPTFILRPKSYTYFDRILLLVLKPHNTLEEAVAARHVIWMQNRKVLLQYWEWCSIHSRAFVAIAVVAPRSRYAVVELDLYGLGAGGFDKEAGREVLRAILEQPLKAGTVFIVSPTYVSASVPEKSARELASRIYGIAQGALSLDQITHEQWIRGDLDRTKIGGCKKSAFAPVSGLATAEVIEALLKDTGAAFG